LKYSFSVNIEPKDTAFSSEKIKEIVQNGTDKYTEKNGVITFTIKNSYGGIKIIPENGYKEYHRYKLSYTIQRTNTGTLLYNVGTDA
jgi:hypothetical protein